MFTGLIERTGRIAAIEPSPAGKTLLVDAGGWGKGFEHGESIAVSGCCLTLAPEPGAGTDEGLLRFDVVPETLAKTTLGSLQPGATVNLERSATASTLLGGHVVQGHVEGVGVVRRILTSPEWRVTIEAPTDLMACVTPKGSIAVEGVSLTIAAADVERRTFDIALIPTTLEKTTLRELVVGSRVNLETDILARTVVHYLRHFAGANTR